MPAMRPRQERGHAGRRLPILLQMRALQVLLRPKSAHAAAGEWLTLRLHQIAVVDSANAWDRRSGRRPGDHRTTDTSAISFDLMAWTCASSADVCSNQ